MPEKNALPDSMLRLARSWWFLPVGAYLCSIPILGIAAIFFPAVIANAPLGILSFFDNVSLDRSSLSEGQQRSAILIQVIFWLTFAVGLAGRRFLPISVLRPIWVTLLIALILTLSGCGIHFGAGLRNPGNWH